MKKQITAKYEYECDRCNKREQCDTEPVGWSHLTIVPLDGSPQSVDVSAHLCGSCSREVKELATGHFVNWVPRSVIDKIQANDPCPRFTIKPPANDRAWAR